jgi:hypothetical protein
MKGTAAMKSIHMYLKAFFLSPKVIPTAFGEYPIIRATIRGRRR